MSIQRLKKILNRESNWIKNDLFQDREGNSIKPNGSFGEWDKKMAKASKFSLQGALYYCFPNDEDRQSIVEKMRPYFKRGKYLAQFNDDPSTTFEDIQYILNKL